MTSFQWEDQDFSKKVASKLAFYYTAFPQEKAFIHLDKPYYATGDTLWFKAYLLEGTLHIADSVSQLLYVDLIEESTGKSLALKRIRLEEGLGYGDFILPDSIANHNFTIRAYTNWMRNFPEYFFYQKNIHLINSKKHLTPLAGHELDVQFFPEGGQLLSGVNCRVAFKATDKRGLGQDISGFVLNQNKDTVASFKSEHLGIGRFQITSSRENKYQIVVAGKNGNFQRFAFPEIYSDNYALLVDNTSSAETMRILIYHNFADEREKMVSIVAHTRGVVAYSAQKVVSEKGLMITIPKADLNDGIMHLTLFDQKQRPVCERLVYIDHGKKLNITIRPDKTNYRIREKVKVEVNLADPSGKPVETSFSVSVTDGGQITRAVYDESSVSWLNLSSDLRGFIEQPSYYFDQSNPLRKIYLDYLMMSQGWSRFQWKEVLSDTLKSARFEIEKGITMQGQVLQNKKNTGKKTVFSVFIDSKEVKTIFTTKTEDSGYFKIANLVFSDTANVRLQATGERSDKNLFFQIQPFETPNTDNEKRPFNFARGDSVKFSKLFKDADEHFSLQNSLITGKQQQLNVVTIRSKKSPVRDKGKLYTSADVTLDVTAQMASFAMSVMDLIKGKVAGVDVVGTGPNASVSIRGSFGEPLFLLDGMPGGKDLVNSLNVNDVDYIDVLKGASAAIYGSRAGNGVIAVYTKRVSDQSPVSLAANHDILNIRIAGFYNAREFYLPKYQVGESNYAADYRSVIYWAPMLKTDKDGKSFFEYYNSDARNKMIIHLETISPYGLPGSAKADYFVQ